MSSRDLILSALRAAAAPAAPLARVRSPAASIADAPARLAAALTAVGGSLVRVPAGGLAAAVAALVARVGAASVASLVPDAGPGTVPMGSLSDPHQLEGIDLAILAGAFAVAENGAVWVPDTHLGSLRATFVIAEHLALVVRSDALVSDMHEAYERISFDRAGFGVFIAGPSKTADIEQALVIGAHGARSCTVLLVE